MPITHPRRHTSAILAAWCAALLLLLVPGTAQQPVPADKPTAYPAWWYARGVIPRLHPTDPSTTYSAHYPDTDDYAALNVGQLKTFAVAAFDEFEAKVPGGAGPRLSALIGDWYQKDDNGNLLQVGGIRVARTNGTDNYAAVTVGQLKSIAGLFYQRLIEQRFASSYPWVPGVVEDSQAVANLGQAKSLSNFNPDRDDDHDGLSDAWESNLFSDRQGNGVPEIDDDGDGLTNLEEYELGTNPRDYSSGSPLIDLLTGSSQTGRPNSWSSVIKFETRDRKGRALGGVSVSIAITANPGALSLVFGGAESSALTITTNAGGLAEFYARLPNSWMTTQQIQLNTGNSQAYVTAQSTVPVGSGAADPSEFQLIRTGSNELTLEWQDNSANETGFQVFRRTEEGEWIPLGEGPLPPDTTSFVDSKVEEEELYIYVVYAL